MEGRTTLAVAGEPGTTACDPPTAAPSSENVTDPVGRVVPAAAGVMAAVTARELPPEGVVVAGVMVIVVGSLGTVTVTEVAVELA